ncbi:ATP-dependent DNA helicase [Methanosarcina lacustris Z-7289]|uniref:ATP-dependent DNA helicase n=1 Tax=Methanosarcina lacustris Z-7289 TaxID=1434111 RepID=A0A0E3WS51_9EURY|nr:ATP-binding protein [Methanosarcina lacustris]AKB74105.1 ATP-dependent DNA helicase [Methanosarcina lacustris Z-7289]
MNSYFKLKESETLELKKSTAQLKPAVISIVAMLNKHQEGKLYFGVRDDGSIVG